MHKKIKRNLKFLSLFVIIGLILCYIIELNGWFMLDFGEIILLLIIVTVIFTVIMFFDTGVSALEENGDSSLDNDGCFYAKSATQTKNPKLQKTKNNSTWKLMLKYVFYTILVVIGVIGLFILILISILMQLPPGTDM